MISAGQLLLGEVTREISGAIEISRKDRQPSEKIKNTCFAWAGGTFFPVVLYVVSVFSSGGKKVLVQIRMYYLEYNTVVVVC
jgi:hypothetical protein